MGAATRFARVGTTALLAAAVLATAVGPTHIRAADPRGTSWTIHNEITDGQTSDTVNGVTTETHSINNTTHATSSNGDVIDDVQTNQKNADGSGSDHEKIDIQNGDGSGAGLDRGSTWDPEGNRFDQGTETMTDTDGNRTIWTTWEQFDRAGHSLRKGEDVKHDKVPAPTPRLSIAPSSSHPAGTASSGPVGPPSTAKPSTKATAGTSGSQAATGDPNYWTGSITYKFAGSAGGPDSEGQTDSGTYNDSATYTVVLRRDNPISSSASWSVGLGMATGSVDEDLKEVSDQGGVWRMTLHGGGWANVPTGACRLTFAADRRSYSIECSGISVDPVEYVGYEGDQVEEGPRTVTWGPPNFIVKGIPIASGSTDLSGSRKVDVFVPTAGSKPAQVQADISWSLSPKSGATPSAPPDVTGKIDLNGPPLAVSISHPNQRAVVGLPLNLGQKVTVHIVGNSIGPMKVSLFKDGSSSSIAVVTSSSSIFDLVTQTAVSSGSCSIEVMPGQGKTGDFSISATGS